MPIGLVIAGSTYNRIVRKLLDGATNLQSYVNGVIGHTKNWDEHIQTSRDFFERVKHGRLNLKPSKCEIGFGTVKFLGHTLNSNFIGPFQETTGMILEMPRPRTKKQAHSLLGLINFYRRYIPDCATLGAKGWSFFCLSVIPICQYPDRRSIVAKYFDPLRLSRASWMSGKGYASFFDTALTFR